MFRKQDFKKVDLLGSGKKNTKIYKAEHIPTGKYYALKEVEAKTLEKLNEYKVSSPFIIPLTTIFQTMIGGGNPAFQSSEPPERSLILWILLL